MPKPPGSDPIERLQEKKPARRRPLQRVRVFGVVAAWIGGVACGWCVSLQADLLSAVLRGAAAWLGFMIVWMVGTSVCEQLISSSRPIGERGGSPDSD